MNRASNKKYPKRNSSRHVECIPGQIQQLEGLLPLLDYSEQSLQACRDANHTRYCGSQASGVGHHPISQHTEVERVAYVAPVRLSRLPAQGPGRPPYSHRCVACPTGGLPHRRSTTIRAVHETDSALSGLVANWSHKHGSGVFILNATY